MSKLEDLQPNAAVRGILPDALITVVSVQWFGSEALELTYKTPAGKVANELLYRHDEPRLEVVELGRPWSFDGDGGLFRLVSEAHRIHLAHLFDPVLAVHTSVVDPLPHQITAVYDSMLPRQPLRFLLADDPGAGKTIMAGLFIKELIARGDLQRCLIVCPGSLAEQWQDELYRRLHLPFLISSRSYSANASTIHRMSTDSGSSPSLVASAVRTVAPSRQDRTSRRRVARGSNGLHRRVARSSNCSPCSRDRRDLAKDAHLRVHRGGRRALGALIDWRLRPRPESARMRRAGRSW